MYLPDNSSCPGIYVIRNTYSDKIYVGKSRNMLMRWANHIMFLEGGTHTVAGLQEDWLRDGASAFTFDVLERCSLSVLDARERYYIRTLGPEYNSNMFTAKSAGLLMKERALRRGELDLNRGVIRYE